MFKVETVNDIRVLKEARSLIAGGWTQCADARDANDDVVQARDEKATCFCIYGALIRVGSYNRAVSELRQTLGNDELAGWQDKVERKKEEVLDLFDRTIARLEEDGRSP